VTITVLLSPVVKYHGLAPRNLMPPRFLMRPLLNGCTLGRRVDTLCSKLLMRWNCLSASDPETGHRAKLLRH
jgi:hypothetical protein